jgi:hypothetical protein
MNEPTKQDWKDWYEHHTSSDERWAELVGYCECEEPYPSPDHGDKCVKCGKLTTLTNTQVNSLYIKTFKKGK